MRKLLVLAHRWVALLAGLLLALLGLTGSLMVWQAEIDAALNPRWFAMDAACAPSRQPVADVLALLARNAPQARPAIVVAPQRDGAAYQVWERRDAATGWRREHFIDPACGRYLGSRDRGALRLDSAHAAVVLYELHSKLLSGERGHIVVGIGGIVLFGLALSGVVLAWPRGGGLTAWRRVLGVKATASKARLWFDIHRATGMWLAPLCLLLTITGAALVFDDQARALVVTVLPTQTLPKLPTRLPTKLPKMAAAPIATGQALAALAPDELVQRALREFPDAQWSRLTLPAANDAAQAEVRLLQRAEPRADTGSTRVRLGADGQVAARYDPLQAPVGNRLLDWVFPLHSGEALGFAARVLWSVFGLVPTLLLGSGLWLWWRRTKAPNPRGSARPWRAASTMQR
jgi:uncharacterized iron-regulated membrane protein